MKQLARVVRGNLKRVREVSEHVSNRPVSFEQIGNSRLLVKPRHGQRQLAVFQGHVPLSPKGLEHGISALTIPNPDRLLNALNGLGAERIDGQPVVFAHGAALAHDGTVVTLNIALVLGRVQNLD